MWLEARNLKLGYPTKKLAPRQEGPFIIERVLGPLTYQLKLPKTWRIHPVFHVTLLTPFKENPIYGQGFTKPPPNQTEDGEEYKVEAIVEHRKRGNGYHYLMKWKGYETAENTWEPLSNLKNATDIIKKWHEDNPKQQKPSSLLLAIMQLPSDII